MRLLTTDEFTTRVGLDEVLQIAGLGSFNRPHGRAPDLERIVEAIDFAEDLLLGYARARYPALERQAPEETPDLIKGFVADIARYRLRLRAGGQGQVAEDVKRRYEDALSFFKDVARGRAELPMEGQPINGEASGTVLAHVDPSPLPSILKGWRP